MNKNNEQLKKEWNTLKDLLKDINMPSNLSCSLNAGTLIIDYVFSSLEKLKEQKEKIKSEKNDI